MMHPAIEQGALLDFWSVYERLVEAHHETMLEAALREPPLVTEVDDATIADLVRYARSGLRALGDAVGNGDWPAYVAALHRIGQRYAEHGLSFASWYSVTRIFHRRVVPALLAEYQASPRRMEAALAAALELLDFSTAVLARSFQARQDDRFRALVDNIKDYAIYLLDPDGAIASWNGGGEALIGYSEHEAVGRHVELLFSAADRRAGEPARMLEVAARRGRFEEELQLERKGGSRFWAEVVVTAMRGAGDQLVGFAQIVRDLTERKLFEATLDQRTQQLEDTNRELEAFSYSTAHDLRSPLRAMSGLAQLVLEDHREGLSPEAVDYLMRIQAASVRMGALIDALLELFRMSRGEIRIAAVDLTQVARGVAAQLAVFEPRRVVDVTIADGLVAHADPGLARTLLENLIGNAWKFTARADAARIEVGGDGRMFFVRDNGAGFDMAHAHRLFAPFVRLHASEQFAGTGVGLANVQRIVHRHGGRIWVEAAPGEGATFFFTLAPPPSAPSPSASSPSPSP